MSLKGSRIGQAIILPLIFASIAGAGENGYVGNDVCAGCHKSIAATQARTNMARTWQSTASAQLPPNYSETHAEGPAPEIQYAVKRSGEKLQYRVQMPSRPPHEFPVEAIVGGQRHGLSFLFRVPAVEGSPLPRARLLEARYFHYAEQKKLAFSLGFPEDKPLNYETAFGRVLTPYLEQRCLNCHGSPRSYGSRMQTGVACENCHGPGQAHLAALSSHSRDPGILNPDKLPIAERFRPCAQCHSGSSIVEDPMPDDVLISDQVTALKNSECWRQTGGQITCTNCHNPHEDAPAEVLVARSEKTCLQCHSSAVAKHAGVCAVNRTAGCVGCHMTSEIRGAFTIAEHWIRVLPGQKADGVPDPAWRSTVMPKHLFLRMMVLDDRAKAAAMKQQLESGGSFYEQTQANSIDRDTAGSGGYLGDLEAGRLDPAWSAAALKLQPGEISEIVEGNGKYVILQRMPRNFRQEAELVFNHAMELRKQGQPQQAIGEMLEALKIYPHLLRALTWLGAMYGQQGNAAASAGVLRTATDLYPQDAGAHFNLALAYGAMSNAQEIPEYKRTLEIDPDYVLAYLNWGSALYEKDQFDDAIKVYRQGIDVNPLFASLHYSLGLALQQQHKTAEANAELALAATIDPNVDKR